MKKLRSNKYYVLIFFLLFIFNYMAYAQDEPEAQKEIVYLHYFNINNNLQYLQVESFLKTGRKLEPQGNKVFQLYLDSISADNLINKVLTDKNGKARAVIPPKLKTIWDKASEHTFIVVAEGTRKEEETTTEFPITKAKIVLDTATVDGVRSITASVVKLENNEWIPAEDVEMRLGIQRMDNSILSAGDEATYYTDSDGKVEVEFNKDSLPGDLNGDIVIAALVEDDEQIGNISIEKTVAWGVPLKEDKNFFRQRTLWGTRSMVPYWLLTLAYSIIIGVWATLIYLVFQLIKIKKLGT